MCDPSHLFDARTVPYILWYLVDALDGVVTYVLLKDHVLHPDTGVASGTDGVGRGWESR